MVEAQIQINGEDCDLLFPTPSGRLWCQRNFYRDVWKPAQEASGLDIRPHECRHSYVTHLRAVGINDADLAEIAGHRVETISPWKSAAKQVFSTMEGDDFEAVDVRTFDVDEYMGRFENRSIGKYSSDSLRAYRQRFKKAVEAYRAYLADPNWRPPAPRRSQRSQKANGDSAKRPKPGARTTPDVPMDIPSASPSTALIAYPFPLKNGQMAQLHLPAQGLDKEDADRLTHFIRALVFDQQAQLSPGDQPEDT